MSIYETIGIAYVIYHTAASTVGHFYLAWQGAKRLRAQVATGREFDCLKDFTPKGIR
jgi:hypothetical protein